MEEIPPAYERVLSQDEICQILAKVEVVAEVWRRTEHQTSDAIRTAVQRLRDGAPQRVPVWGFGFSSIVRQVLEWARTPARPAA